MEFIELIKTPVLPGVTMTDLLGNQMKGTICITSHHLIMSSRNGTQGAQGIDDEITLLHSMIDVVERKPNLQKTGGVIVIKLKNFRVLNIDITGYEQFDNIARSLEWLSHLEEPRLSYSHFYNSEFIIVEDGWTAYSIEKEFSNLDAKWRVSYVNTGFGVCASYPEAVVVPSSISDDALRKAAQFRCMGRFPVMSYFHTSTKRALLRSGQPMVGTNSKRCTEDERLLNLVLGTGERGFIIDTRKPELAQAARNKGGGFEPEMHYSLWRRSHKPIERYSNLLESYNKLIEACNDGSLSMDRWLSKLDSSNWLSHIESILDAACSVAQCLEHERSSVLVHGTEGMDSTLQVCSLVQIILNPDCRTVQGFQALIEREWLQAGHPFEARCEHGPFTVPSNRTREQAPIFLQFLDCVYQIHQQFPCSFQFNEQFLAFLFENAYASKFGTFIGNCVKERQELGLEKKTISIWSYLNRLEVMRSFLNPLYEPNNNILWPSVAPQSLNLWRNLYCKWITDQSSRQISQDKIEELIEEASELRNKVSKMRTKIAQFKSSTEKNA